MDIVILAFGVNILRKPNIYISRKRECENFLQNNDLRETKYF